MQKEKGFADLIEQILSSDGDFTRLSIGVGCGESLAQCSRRLLKIVHPDKLDWLKDDDLKRKAEEAAAVINSW